MSTALGPHLQMAELARHLALMYEADKNLDLGQLVSHYVDEVDVNVQSDVFDHSSFVGRIRDGLAAEATLAGDCRRRDYLLAVVEALDGRG